VTERHRLLILLGLVGSFLLGVYGMAAVTGCGLR
jgi:hypothetical protein